MKSREAWTKWADDRKQRALDADFDKDLAVKPRLARVATKGYPVPALCRQANIPEPECEYAWHPSRKFRADFAWPSLRVLVEVDGGLFVNGGHSRGAARLHDMQKDREAVLLGWRVLRYSPDEVVYIPLDIRKLLA